MSARRPVLLLVAVLRTAFGAPTVAGDLIITDDAASNIGPVTEVGGNLIIVGTSLRTVGSLASLTRVGGKLEVRNNHRLRNLDWLQRLDVVEGRVILAGNAALENIDGLMNLTLASSIEVFDNPALTIVNGFHRLTLVPCTLAFVNNSALTLVGGFSKFLGAPSSAKLLDHCEGIGLGESAIVFRNNDALTTVRGFDALEAHGLRLVGNRALANITGFRDLRHIDGGLKIVGNDALRFVSLQRVRTITGSCDISDNMMLKTLQFKISNIESAILLDFALRITNNSALEELWFRNLRSVDGPMNISNNRAMVVIRSSKTVTVRGKLDIQGNAGLKTVSLQIVSIAGSLLIAENPVLQNITLEPFWSVTEYFFVYGNPALESVHTTLGEMKGSLRVFDNSLLSDLSFDSLNIVWGDLVISSDSVLVWEGFPQLKMVWGSLELSSPDEGWRRTERMCDHIFMHLGSVGGDLLISHIGATMLRGFVNLSSVRGMLDITENPVLQSIEGFDILHEVRGTLQISNNRLLSTVRGFGAVHNLGKLRIEGNPMLTEIHGLWNLKQDCGIFGMPDQYGFDCMTHPWHVISISLFSIALFTVSFMLTATCKSRFPIAAITLSGSRLFVRTKKPHCFHPREGASFFVRLKGTGCQFLDKPSDMLKAKVTGTRELELVGMAIERMVEEASLHRAAALGVLSVRARDEFRLIGWPLPLICWVSLFVLAWFVCNFVVKLSVQEYFLVAGVAIASGIIIPATYRLLELSMRKSRARQKASVFQEAELVQQLEEACWEDDFQAKDTIRDQLINKVGWTQEGFDDRWNTMVQRQSMEAGVSVAYLLSDEFRILARQRSGKEDPTFYDLKDAFFLCSEPLGVNQTCPRDGQLGVALTDWLPRRHRRACTHFLSWTWGYTFDQVRGALRQWLEQTGLDAAKTFLYMCFFVNNQHRILIAGTSSGSDDLESVFESNLRRIGKMVALLDDWNEPLYFSRIWTVFEQFTAVKLGIDVEIIIPPRATRALVTEIRKGEIGITRLKRSLCTVDSQNAKAWSKQDEKKVKKAIQDTIGFDAVNRKLCQFMVAWIAKQVQSHLTTLVLSGYSQHLNAISSSSEEEVMPVRSFESSPS